MGAGALALRTATYKYPEFSFAPSTAPESWLWRNAIPYEFAFDLAEGDFQVLWQPTWNFKHTNAGLRLGLGFTGGVFTSSAGVRDVIHNFENTIFFTVGIADIPGLVYWMSQ
jgi:hypothetical protein